MAEIKKLQIKTIEVPITGTAPLITHKWAEKTKRMMLEAQMGKTKNKKHEIKNPKRDYLAAIHWIDEETNRSGFPAVGFKAAMVRAGKGLGHSMTDLRGALFVVPDEGDLVEITGAHEMREDIVRVANGNPDIRHRPMYKDWSAILTIKFNEGMLSVDEVTQLVYAAGFSSGIGEWRPEKCATGSYGTWTIEGMEES